VNTPIKREDIRKGDVIVQRYEFTALVDFEDAGPDSATYELIERPVTLPTEPGVYLDAESGAWRLFEGRGLISLEEKEGDYNPDRYTPFTLLRPVAEVAAEVLAALWLLRGDLVAAGDADDVRHLLNELEQKFGVTK